MRPISAGFEMFFMVGDVPVDVGFNLAPNIGDTENLRQKHHAYRVVSEWDGSENLVAEHEFRARLFNQGGRADKPRDVGAADQELSRHDLKTRARIEVLR